MVRQEDDSSQYTYSGVPCYQSDGDGPFRPAAGNHELMTESDGPSARSGALNQKTPDNLSQEEYEAILGMGKVLEAFDLREKVGFLQVEKDSVYGAAISIPQIARSCRWPMSMIILTIRTYMFLALNFVVQYLFTYYIYDEQTNMNPFAGQMHLCDFAAGIQKCPGGPNCIGPAGTDYDNPGRLYSYDIWSTRVFLRDTLASIFPGHADAINKVDPGEYGVESWSCRLLCIFVFIVQIADEFQSIVDLGYMLWYLPSVPQSWVGFERPKWGEKDYVKSVHDWKEYNFTKFKVAGMPVAWKVFNSVLLLLPRFLLWKNLSFAGVYFLMETASMVDQIVNTTALSFIFAFDELILERLSSQASVHMVSNMEDYPLFDDAVKETEADQEVMNRYFDSEIKFSGRRLVRLLPKRLVWAISLMLLFVVEYYWSNCHMQPDGGFISADLYLPETAHLNPLCLLIRCTEEHGEPIWSMPEPSSGHDEA